MIKKLSTKYCLENYKKLPLEQKGSGRVLLPRYLKSFYVGLIMDNEKYKKALPKELEIFFKELSVSELILTFDAPIQWTFWDPRREKRSKLEIEALDYLKQLKVSRKFIGSLKIPLSDFANFLKYFSRLTIIGYGWHIMDHEQTILISFDNVIIIRALTKKYLNTIPPALKHTKFVKLEKAAPNVHKFT